MIWALLSGCVFIGGVCDTTDVVATIASGETVEIEMCGGEQVQVLAVTGGSYPLVSTSPGVLWSNPYICSQDSDNWFVTIERTQGGCGPVEVSIEDGDYPFDTGFGERVCPDARIPLGVQVGEGLADVFTCGMTELYPPTSCGLEGEQAVFFWVAPADGVYRFDTRGSDFPTVVSLRESCPGRELACASADLEDPFAAPAAAVELEMVAGQEVELFVGGAFGSCGQAMISVLPAAPQVDVIWGTTSVQVDIDDDGGRSWWFGMAETEVSPAIGWYGEDCGRDGFCHPFDSTGGTLSYVTSPNEVYAGESTLFDTRFSPTFVLQDQDSGFCWTWGHDPSYYSECDRLPLDPDDFDARIPSSTRTYEGTTCGTVDDTPNACGLNGEEYTLRFDPPYTSTWVFDVLGSAQRPVVDFRDEAGNSLLCDENSPVASAPDLGGPVLMSLEALGGCGEFMVRVYEETTSCADALGYNPTPGMAPYLTPSATPLTLTVEDQEDWFQIDVGAGDVCELTLSDPAMWGETYRLEDMTPRGFPTVSTSMFESLWVRVVAPRDSQCHPYELTYTCASQCTDMEGPEDYDTPDNAAPIGEGTITDVSNDPDFFELFIDPDVIVDVSTVSPGVRTLLLLAPEPPFDVLAQAVAPPYALSYTNDTGLASVLIGVEGDTCTSYDLDVSTQDVPAP